MSFPSCLNLETPRSLQGKPRAAQLPGVGRGPSPSWLSLPAQAVGWGPFASCGFWSLCSWHQCQTGSGYQLCPPPHTLGPLGARRQICQGKQGGEERGRGLPLGWGRGCGTPCIKRSESTIFHCWRSQPRHQLLGESSLKSLLILFLPLNFFSPFFAGVLDKASLPPLLSLPQPTQEALEPKEGLKPGAGGKELHVCALVDAWVCLGGWDALLRFPASLCVHLEVCIL